MLREASKENPVTSEEIQQEVGISDHEGNPNTRAMIRELVEKERLPVASCQHGYYMITTQKELRSYLDHLQNRKQGIDHRIKIVRRAWNENGSPATGSPTSLLRWER